MPLHCPIVYIFLPLVALSCSSPKTPKDIAERYRATIETELHNTIENISNLLINKTCFDYKPKRTCASSNHSLVTTLFCITCKMNTLHVNLTERLTDSVEISVGCHCPVKPTKQTKRREPTPLNERHKDKRHIKKKLCRTKALLLSLEEYFQQLNSAASTGHDTGD